MAQDTAPAAAASDAQALPDITDLTSLLAWREQGHPIAQFNLGVKYDFGQGVKRYRACRALRTAGSGARAWRRHSQPFRGIYFEGLGVQRDLVRATMWFHADAEPA